MPYIPGQGAFSYLDNLQQQADQARQDALLAQQQAAAYAQQQQAETEAYRQQLDDMLAQQQASYDQALQQMQQPTPAVSAAGASAVDGTVQTTGNPLVDRFIAESGNTQFMPEGGATYFNNKAVDEWLDREAARNGWNATKRAVERKKLTDALVKLTGNSRLFEVEDRGFTGLVGDFANRAVGTTVTGLMDLVGVASTYVGETMNNVGLGDGRLDASRAVLDASEGAKRMFRSARSYESQDNERAFEMTAGLGDMLDALAYNPSGLTDFAGDLVGIVFGPGVVGKGVSAGGKAILRSGATAAAAAGGKVTPAAAKALGLSDEILRGGGAKIGELTGISGLVNRQAVGARIMGAGETLTDITRTIGFQAALEGTSNTADILRQNGAYNAQTGTYNGDVLNAAAVAGGLTGGVTYGLGRFLPTAEGSLLRMANTTRAEASTLGRMVMKGETTIDDALKAVSTDLQQGMLSPEARSVLSEISARLTTEQGKAALMNAVDKGSIFRTVLTGAKPLTSGMMSEGFEEGLVGLISSAAAQSVSGDGNFSWDKIDWARAATDAGKAAVVGALMGTAVGGLKLAHDYRDANTNLDKAIAEYQEKVNGMMADNDAQVAAYESALTNAGGINPLADTNLNVLATTPSDVRALTEQVRSNAAAANAAAGLQQNMPVDVLRLPAPGQTSPAELAVYNPARRRLETLAEWQAADNAAREHNAQLDALAEQIVHEQPIDEMVLDVLSNPTGAARQALNVHENLNASGRSRAARAFNLHALNEQTVRAALTRSAEQVDYEVRQLRELGLRDNVPDTVLKDIEQAAYISDGFSTVEEMVNRMGDSVGYIPQNVRNNIALLSKIDKSVAILSDPELPANERAVVADSVAVIRSNPSLNRRLQATYDWVVNKFGAMVGKPVLPAFGRVAETARREASLAKPKADVRLSDTTTVSALLKPLGVDSNTIKALSDQVNKIKSTSRGKNSVRAAVMNYIEASIVTEQDADVETYREQAYQKVFDYYNTREDDGEAVSDLTRTFFEGSDNPPEVGLDRLLEEAVDDVIRAKYTRRAEVAADEAKKLGLTPSVTLDGSDAAAIADTARAMERNGKTVTADLFSAPALPAVDLRPADKIPAVDLFSPSAETPRAPQGKRAPADLFSETPTDVQAAFDAQAEADLAALDKRFGKRDLFSDDFDSFNDYDDFDVSSYARYQRAKWDTMTETEQTLAVQQETIRRATNAISAAFGKDFMRHVVFVSPNSQSLADSNTTAYVLDGDPSTVYVVADPTRADHQFVYSVAHEMLHQHADVAVRGKTTQWGDYKQTMDKFAQHPFVQELMGAMRYTYPELDSYALAEEALAEIHAARTSPKGWDTLRETWGINTKPPTDLRAKSSGLMAQIINWFKRMVAQWRGKPRTTDAELAEFFRVVSQSRPDAAAQVRTPEAAQQYRARMEFEAARQRSDYYHGMARDITPDFDALPAQQQRSILTDLAQRNGDELSAQELGLQVRYAKRPYGSESGESTAGDQPKKHAGAPHAEPYPDGTVERLFREQAEQAAQIPPSSDRDGQRHMAHKLVRQLNIYLNRAPDAEYNADVHGVPVGLISLVNSGDNTAEVRVVMNDPDNGVVGVMHTEPVKGDIDGAMYSAWEWLNTTYPAQYSRPSGTTIDPRTGSQLTPSELYVLNRADYMGLTSPRVREWTNWLREKLPAQYIPVLDAFLDFVSALRTRWVDVYTSMKEVELAYEKATGKPSNVITRMQRDIGEGMAFLHRNFNAGSVVETAGKQQSMRDRTEAIRDAMLREGVPQERINKFLYGLEEAVRYNQFMNSPQSEGHWAEREDGTKYIVNRNNGGEALSVTGFNFRDLNTLDPNVGQADLGARRFLAALAGMSVEERNRIGRIVAEVSAANRTVIELQHQRGVLNKTDYTNRMRRGKRELDAAFPELAAQGYDFSGFFITMRDDDSSAFTTRDSKGRTTAVENVLGNTAAVWEADVKKAFRNNEMAQFALLVMSMPNRHFAIEPVTPVANPDDPTGAPLWEESTKGEKGSTVVYINGVPVRLVAKSKTAAMMFDAEAMHPAIAKVGSLNHYFNQFKTSLNPSYPVVGFVRDMMTGYLNISGAIGEQYVSSKDAATVGTRAVGYALRYLFVPNKGNLFYGTWRGEQGDVWAQVYQRLGAGMLFGDNVNTGAFANINNNPLVSGKVGRATDVLSSAYDKTRSAAARVAETIAYPPETAMRLGVFRAYAEHLLGSQLKPNMTADQIVDLFDQVKSPQNSDYAAAIIVGSKNITSNFQQHGTDSVVRNLFSFHNAVMQGTFATLPQILSTEHGRKASALLLIGAAAAAAAAIGSEDEDEFGNSKYFQNLKRNRSIILGDVAVPIPDEIGWIKNLSDNIVGVMMGKRNIIDASVDQLHASAEMVTTQQWGDTDNAFTNALFAVTPTMAQPLIAISSGHDVFGRKFKNDFAYDAQGKRISYAADVERTTPRATTVGTSLAEFLYGATGGGVDMTGDEVDVVGRSLLGGIYTSFSRTQTESMRSGDGVVSTAGSELVHGVRAIKIDRRSDDAWKDLGERLGVSQRHEGGMMDVLNSKDRPETAEAYKLYRRGDERSRKAKSDMGYSYKQLHDMIGKAEAEGRYQDVRDLRADMRTIKVNRDEIRREVMAEINALGVK